MTERLENSVKDQTILIDGELKVELLRARPYY